MVCEFVAVLILGFIVVVYQVYFLRNRLKVSSKEDAGYVLGRRSSSSWEDVAVVVGKM